MANLINNSSFNTAVSNVSGSSGVSTDTGASNVVKAGSTVSFIAGNNTVIAKDGLNYTISVSDMPTFTTVNATTVNANNLTVGGNGGSLTVAGNTTIDMGNNQIHNVAAGTNATDAVNVAQLNNSVANINNKIDGVKRENRRGIATADALAMVPQATLPGKSLLSASTAYYRGQSSLAVGYSRLSDNGKILLKSGVSTSVNSSKDTIFGASIGYQW